MWSFFKKKPSKDDVKSGKAISSRHIDEDRNARPRKEKDKKKKIEIDRDILKLAEQEEANTRFEKSKEKGKRKQVEDKGKIEHSKEHVKKQDVNPPPSICNGCNSAIEDGLYVPAFDVLWHRPCYILHCHKPNDSKKEIPSSKEQCHRSSYNDHHRICYVCGEKIPSTEKGRKYNEHPFWKQRYCPSHDDDRTAKCCSCERLEASETKYVMLADGRWLCRECMECAVMDTHECQPLHFEIREFFDSLNLKIDKIFPLLLVEKEALNKAEAEEKIDNQYEMVTRGICLSEGQFVTSVSRRPTMGPDNKLIGMATKSQRVASECEVTAILILYGLPRLLTGYILAHEMMHAYLRLNSYRNLDPVLEEGLCQVLAHMWLEPQTFASPDVAAAAADSSSASSSGTPPDSTLSKKGDPFVFEKDLVKFCKYQIETDESPLYGVGFKKVTKMMELNNNHFQDTLKDIVSNSKSTPHSKV